MVSHVQILQLIIAYTLAGAFVFTVIMTCLSLVGWVKFADSAQQQKLFYALIVEVVTIGVGFFAGFLKFDPKSVADDIRKQTEVRGDVAKAIGLVDYAERANDFMPQIGKLIADSKKEIFLAGVSFYITLPERKDSLLRKVQNGVKVRILIYDFTSENSTEVAAGFKQSPNQLRDECVTTVDNLLQLKQAVAGTSNSANLEVRLFSETPKARFYMFDMKLPTGRLFFIPHINGVNSPNVPGLLFANSPGSFASIYAPDVEDLWSRAITLEDWLKKHPENLHNNQFGAATNKPAGS
jgi:hypothetical protein